MSDQSLALMALSTVSFLMNVVTWIVGLILALVTMKRLGRPAVLTLAACAIAMVGAILGGITPMALARGAMAARDMASAFALLGVLGAMIHTVTIALLFAAIFLRREEMPRAS